jgi:hypothetical protein
VCVGIKMRVFNVYGDRLLWVERTSPCIYLLLSHLDMQGGVNIISAESL